MNRIRVWALALVVGASCTVAALPSTVEAGVAVHFEAETLAALLGAASTQDIDFPINDKRTIRIELRDLKLLELRPAGEASDVRGSIRTSLNVTIPELDVEMSLEPTVVLDVVDVDGVNLFEMRFAELRVPVPILGDFDIAPFVQPLRYPAEDLWYLPGARGTVHLRSRLVNITMGQRAIRFDFELDITDP
jgi:hypothetical protein